MIVIDEAKSCADAEMVEFCAVFLLFLRVIEVYSVDVKDSKYEIWIFLQKLNCVEVEFFVLCCNVICYIYNNYVHGGEFINTYLGNKMTCFSVAQSVFYNIIE